MKYQVYNKKRILWTFFTIILLQAGQGFSQGFIKNYPINSNQWFYPANVVLADGGYCITTLASPDLANNTAMATQMFTDPDGEQTALFDDTTFIGNTANTAILGCGQFVGVKLFWDANDNAFSIVERFDSDGTVSWRDTLAQPPTPHDAAFLRVIGVSDGGILLVGGQNLFLRKLDANGNVLFTITPQIPVANAQSHQLGFLQATSDGGALVAAASTVNNTSVYSLLKFTATGDVEWQISPFSEYYTSVDYAQDGSFYGVELGGSNAPPVTDACDLVKHAPNGNMLWQIALRDALQRPEFNTDYVLATNDNGALVVGGYQPLPGFSYGITVMGRFDADGSLIWKKEYVNLERVFVSSGIALADGSFVFTGAQYDELMLLKIDSAGAIYPNALAGTIVRDADDDCLADNDEIPLAGWIVKATANGAEYFGVTNDTGAYLISDLPGGPAYSIDLLVQTPSYLWEPCAVQTLTMPADTLGLTLQAHVAIGQLAACPVMTVNLAMPPLRLCWNNIIALNYCNLGTSDAEDAAVEVYLPAGVIAVNASLPYTQNGQTLRFELGDVPPVECGQINLTAYVSCDSLQLGQTVCVEAHVFPDSFCIENPNWSGASIEVEADCLGDTVQLRVRNAGTAPTTTPIGYLIIDDDVVMMQGTIPAGFPNTGIENILLPAGGSTFRISSEQEPNHPVSGNPSVAVEGCNGWGFGYVLPFLNLTGDPFGDLECREVVGSYDPNEKQTFPQGIHDQHFIEPGTPLEYILYFQNTGTDTAFRVVLRDTLSPWLDPATLRPGAASHPYQWTLEGQGRLKFIFDPIALPDSNVNAAGSQGFVQFSIRPRSDVPLGTVIPNRAGIYFDFNGVVLTNTVFHTVDSAFLEIDIVSADEKQPMALVAVYPNPATEMVSLILKNNDFSGKRILLLTDASGKIVLQKDFTGGKVVLQRNALPAGIYFVKIVENEQIMATGKMIWK